MLNEEEWKTRVSSTQIGHRVAEIARPLAAMRSVAATELLRRQVGKDRWMTLTRQVCAATIAHDRQRPARRKTPRSGLAYF